MSLSVSEHEKPHRTLITSADVRELPAITATAVNGNKRIRTNHQSQYDDNIAQFFDIFNDRTARDGLFWGYLQGYFTNNKQLTGDGAIAVDFGCGAGWLTSRLAGYFGSVYGIDTSEAMLKVAFDNKRSDNVRFRQTAPDNIKEKCSFVAAVHVHYHFDTKQKLRDELFRAANEMLKPGGEMLLIGCPSDYISKTPPHYTNFISVDDIPEEVKENASQISIIQDEEGYVALEKLQKFPLADGTQMKVVLSTTDIKGKTRQIRLMDTYWSDEALTEAAAEAGLELTNKSNLMWRDHPNAYMVMHFKKKDAGMPAGTTP